jgi:hypothetical protein
MIPDRKLQPHEKRRCFAEAELCPRPAHWEIDNGEGGLVFCCEHHRRQLESLNTLMESWSKEKLDNFEVVLTRAEESEKSVNN